MYEQHCLMVATRVRNELHAAIVTWEWNDALRRLDFKVRLNEGGRVLTATESISQFDLELAVESPWNKTAENLTDKIKHASRNRQNPNRKTG